MASATSAPGMTLPDSHWQMLGACTVRPSEAVSREANSFWERRPAFRHAANVIDSGMLVVFAVEQVVV